jgi:site-specific DNA-methyltransferase (adenine-specific)
MTTLTLLHGDCLEVMKDISANSIDCFICDLPYGCLTTPLKEGKQTETIIQSEGCAWDIKIDLEAFWKQVKRLRKNKHTPVLMFCNTKFGNDLINSNPKWFRYDLVWNKVQGVSFLSANKMPMRSHEMIYIFSESGAYYNRVDVKGDFNKWKVNRENQISTQYGGAKRTSTSGGDGVRCVVSVITHPTSSTRKGHPTEKPEALYKWLIERYCPLGGTILDPTAGSFNSCFTAYEMGRSAIGIEKDDGFFKKASDRLDAL